MQMDEFIQMLRAIEDGRSFEVGFQLQYSPEVGGLTLQDLVGHVHLIHPRALREFFERVEQAEPPIISE